MKINVSKKTMYMVIILICLIGAIVIGRIFYCMYATKDYKKVSATVTEIDWKYGEYNNEASTIMHSIKCQYAIGGQKYSYEFDTPFKFGISEGDEIILYYDSQNPKEIRSKLYIEYMVLFFTVILVLLCSYMAKRAE